MKVITAGPVETDLGTTETTPTIGIIDYSRRVTDDFGITTVVPRGFARRMSVRMSVPREEVDGLQMTLAGLRATSAQWVADDRFDWLNVEGFYKDFEIDLAVGPICYCTLTVEGLAEVDLGIDPGGDPAPGSASTLLLLQPITVTDDVLVASSAAEADYAEWSDETVYDAGDHVIKAATHRIYESVAAGNVGNDPEGVSGLWVDVGPTNRWAMFDQALGSVTTSPDDLIVTVDVAAANAVALLDVVADTVRVEAAGYDTTLAVDGGAAMFLDLPDTVGEITVTIAGAAPISVGTLLFGQLVPLGITEESPTAGIIDYSRKETDDFGEPTIVERAWAKRMSARALIDTDAVDIVANRIATVRAVPSLWIGDQGLNSLIIYGFFKDFEIEVGETVSTLSLSVEGLSTAAPLGDLDFTDVGIVTIRDPDPPATDVPIGSIYYDVNNHPYRFEGMELYCGANQLFCGPDPLLGSGYVDIRDKSLPEIIAELDAADDDGILTIDEKIRVVIPDSARLETIYQGTLARAILLGVDASAMTAARAAWFALRDGLAPAWNDTTQPTTISRADWDSTLDAYRAAIETANTAVTAPSAVTVFPPATQVVKRDQSGAPLAGEFPRTLTPVVKRGAVDITGDDDVAYSIATSNVTATVDDADGSGTKGEIDVTDSTADGHVDLTVQVGEVTYGPYRIAFTSKAESLSISYEDANSIVFHFESGGLTVIEQMGKGTIGPNSTLHIDYPEAYTTKSFGTASGGSSDPSREGDVHAYADDLTGIDIINTQGVTCFYSWRAIGY